MTFEWPFQIMCGKGEQQQIAPAIEKPDGTMLAFEIV